MKKFLLIGLLILAGSVLLWWAALTTERFSALRGAAQLIHLPDDFFTANGTSAPLISERSRFKAKFEFAPKYSGRYQLLVAPVNGKYGEVILAETTLVCTASSSRFESSETQGRVEFDRVLEKGSVGRLLTFDTSRDADVGVNYECMLLIATSQEGFHPKRAFVRKLTDN